MPGREPHCLSCQTHIDYADGLLQEIEQLNYRLKKVERENYRLRHETEEPAGKRSAKATEDTKVFLEAWDELRRKHFPSSRNVNLDPAGSRGRSYMAARRQWSHDDLMKMLRGADLSPWHTSNPDFFKVSSLLTQDPQKNREERIEKHIDRAEAYDRLIAADFSEDRARALIHAGVDKTAQEIGTSAARRCPGCGRDPELDGCFCGSELMRTAA